MDRTLLGNWWAVAVRGLISLAFGVAATLWPHITLAILLILFGTYALYDGVFAVVSAVRSRRRNERWWPVAFEGIAGVVVGLIAILAPVAAAALVFVAIAVWAFVTGALELLAAARLRSELKGAWILTLSGALRLGFGGLLLARRSEGLLTLIALMAAYAFAYGAVLLCLSVALKRHLATGRRPEVRGGMTPQPV
jgi:uncharacterized membrane protein HdeD (DUF308 family)